MAISLKKLVKYPIEVSVDTRYYRDSIPSITINAVSVALLRSYANLALLAVYWFLHLLSDVLDMSARLTIHM